MKGGSSGGPAAPGIDGPPVWHADGEQGDDGQVHLLAADGAPFIRNGRRLAQVAGLPAVQNRLDPVLDHVQFLPRSGQARLQLRKGIGGESQGSMSRNRCQPPCASYPRYDRQVQDFIAADPLRAQRMILGLALAARRARRRGSRLAVFLGHSLGGGADIYLQQRLAAEIRSTGHAVVIRSMPDATWQLELHGDGGVTSGTVTELAALRPMFVQLEGLHVVYSCSVGTPRPQDVPRLIDSLVRQPGSRLEVTFNDFFPLSPAYTLLDSKSAFSGLPLDSADPVHQFVGRDGNVIGLDEWQRLWNRSIAQAHQLTAFSPSSATIIASAWPQHKDRIVVKPHKLPCAVPALHPLPADGTPVIGVLGNINRPKGAAVLEELARVLAVSGTGRLVLIGNLEPGFALARPSLVTGSYDLDHLPKLVARHGISRWFFPSIWPETFSYVVHEMIATQLPVWSFDIGAQADAVSAALARGQPGGLIRLQDGGYDRDELIRCLTGPATPAKAARHVA